MSHKMTGDKVDIPAIAFLPYLHVKFTHRIRHNISGALRYHGVLTTRIAPTKEVGDGPKGLTTRKEQIKL